MHLFCDNIKNKGEKEYKKWRSLGERKKALELYYNEGKMQKEIAEFIDLSVNTIKSWIHRARLENVSKESTDNQINDEIKLIEGNSETQNKVKIEQLRSVKIEIVNKHEENIDKHAKSEIKNLQMQVALLRDFLSRKERKNGIQSVIRKKRHKKPACNGDLRYDNISSRNFVSQKPNEKLVTDITYQQHRELVIFQ